MGPIVFSIYRYFEGGVGDEHENLKTTPVCGRFLQCSFPFSARHSRRDILAVLYCVILFLETSAQNSRETFIGFRGVCHGNNKISLGDFGLWGDFKL